MERAAVAQPEIVAVPGPRTGMRRLWFGLQWLLGLAVAYFVVTSVVANWGQIKNSQARVELDAGALATAAAMVLASYAVLIGAWRIVLAGWSGPTRLRYVEAARIWCLSNLARYVPGKVWQIGGMAALAKRAGVSPWAAAGSAIIVQLVSVATGALITGLAAPEWKAHPWAVAGCGMIAAGTAAALAWRTGTGLLSRWMGAMLGRRLELEPVGKAALLVAAAVSTLAWLAQGVALYLCATGLVGPTRLGVWSAVGIFTGGTLAGLLAVFTPGGLGVREGVLGLWLAPLMGPRRAIIVLIGSRLMLTTTELLAAAITFPVRNLRAESRA
jgi:hypothetical protein